MFSFRKSSAIVIVLLFGVLIAALIFEHRTGSYLPFSLFTRANEELEDYSTGSDIIDEIKENETKPPLILFWTTWFDRAFKITPLKEMGCSPQYNCRFSHNLADIKESDAVIFHWRDFNRNKLPKYRDDSQVWVLYNEEAPPQVSKHTFHPHNSMFNMTVSYRRDSDIWAPYAITRPLRPSELEPKLRVPVPVKESPKTKAAIAWVVSHCPTDSGREDFVEELQKHVKVDVYGKCSKEGLTCKGSHVEDCYQWLSERYTFYLSLENSICKDYVTEKLFQALKTDMIPLVLGGVDYPGLVPPNSYIDVSKFPDVRQLAEYLEKVANDPKLMWEYMAWKRRYIVERTDIVWDGWACRLCQMLVDRTVPTNRKPRNVITWWFDDAKCVDWKGKARTY